MDQTEMPGSYNLYYNLFVGFSLNQPTATDTITGYESQLGSMFKKDIACKMVFIWLFISFIISIITTFKS